MLDLTNVEVVLYLLYKKSKIEKMEYRYISAEEFDLMFEDELDALDLDYQYEKYKTEQYELEKAAYEEALSLAK